MLSLPMVDQMSSTKPSPFTSVFLLPPPGAVRSICGPVFE
jgi:hypothetical protein